MVSNRESRPSVPSSRRKKQFLISECAFLRVVKDAGNPPRITCLMKKGGDCDNAGAYPNGEPCPMAVVRAHIDRTRMSNYWKSMSKHYRKPKEAKKGAFEGHSSKKEEYNFCKRKRRYPDEKTAEEYRRKCEAKRGIALRVLYCPFCKGWHLTHKHADRVFRLDKQMPQP